MFNHGNKTIICRGCVVLRTACLNCSRCDDEVERIITSVRDLLVSQDDKTAEAADSLTRLLECFEAAKERNS